MFCAWQEDGLSDGVQLNQRNIGLLGHSQASTKLGNSHFAACRNRAWARHFMVTRPSAGADPTEYHSGLAPGPLPSPKPLCAARTFGPPWSGWPKSFRNGEDETQRSSAPVPLED